MNLSGVIVVVLVAVWAYVLVPMLLRRYDGATETQSVERFDRAMRVLARRSATQSDRRYDGALPPPAAPRSTPAAAPPADGWAAGDRGTRVGAESIPRRGGPGRSSGPAGQSVPLTRRMRALQVLTALAALLLIAAAARPAMWPLQLLADVALGGYVVHLRRQAVQSPRVAAARAGAARIDVGSARSPGRGGAGPSPGVAASPSPHHPARASAPSISTSRPTQAVARASRVPGTVRAPAAASPTAAADTAAPRTAAPRTAAPPHTAAAVPARGIASTGAAADRSWRPTPVPLPTYLTAPVIRRPAEVGGRTSPARWTGERQLDGDPRDAPLDVDRGASRDEPLTVRRAAGD